MNALTGDSSLAEIVSAMMDPERKTSTTDILSALEDKHEKLIRQIRASMSEANDEDEAVRPLHSHAYGHTPMDSHAYGYEGSPP